MSGLKVTCGAAIVMFLVSTAVTFVVDTQREAEQTTQDKSTKGQARRRAVVSLQQAEEPLSAEQASNASSPTDQPVETNAQLTSESGSSTSPKPAELRSQLLDLIHEDFRESAANAKPTVKQTSFEASRNQPTASTIKRVSFEPQRARSTTPSSPADALASYQGQGIAETIKTLVKQRQSETAVRMLALMRDRLAARVLADIASENPASADELFRAVRALRANELNR